MPTLQNVDVGSPAVLDRLSFVTAPAWSGPRRYHRCARVEGEWGVKTKPKWFRININVSLFIKLFVIKY